MKIEEIYKEAKEFECCPHCGNPDISGHFCENCEKRIAVPDDAGWFAKYIKEKYNLDDKL